MKIRNIEDWNNSKFKQHPLFYLVIFIILFNFTIFINMGKTIEGEDTDYDSHYSVSSEEAIKNSKFLIISSDYVIPIIIIFQLIVIGWFYKKISQNHNYLNNNLKSIFNYILGNLFFCIIYLILNNLINSDSKWFPYFTFFIFLPYIVSQIFFIIFFIRYFQTDYYIKCNECNKFTEISRHWFDHKTNKLDTFSITCLSCNARVELKNNTPLQPSEVYIFNLTE